MGTLSIIQTVGAIFVTYAILYMNIMGTITLYRWVKMKEENRPISVGILFNQYMQESVHIPYVILLGLFLLSIG